MKKLIILSLSLLITGPAFGKPVTCEQARLVATAYYQHYAPAAFTDFSVKESFEVNYDGLITYYAFNFNAGGFIMVSADDAVIPVLGYSYEGYAEKNISNPAAKEWFEGYSQEIFKIVQANLDNKSTIEKWEAIRNGHFDRSVKDVGPLLSTNWDQNEWYNYYCPADAGGPGGRVWAGCVATAVGMIMKYHNFPQTGVGSHTYPAPNYGWQTADFGETSYNWTGMGVSANAGSYQATATLLYHVGVSLNMYYGPDASGASSQDVAPALISYFNYDPSAIRFIIKDDYPISAWEQMLRDDLDKSHPVYYAGDDGTFGHAFVCDGYQMSDNKFHFNWGWSGYSNGYFAIGALNPLGYAFNLNNHAVIGIQPGNPDLIVRFSSPSDNAVFGPESIIDINASVYTGTAEKLELYINDQFIVSVTTPDLSYTWNTSGLSYGTHMLKIVAINATDTVFQPLSVRLGEWIPQNSGFTIPTRGIQYIHAVDSMIVWATAYDGTNPDNSIQEFTKTADGGAYWTAGTINNCSGLAPGMIFALNADTAYCPMYRSSGENPQGIYMTRDGGVTWSQQTTATFGTAGSFPNVVHFFNVNDGWCMGDPIYGHFECYTTTNGGDTWNVVLEENLPAPLSGEFGVVGYYSAAGENTWFGTNKGRVYRSADKGYSWSVSTTTLANRYVDVEFADAFHGIALDKSLNSAGAMSETFDGGITWQDITASGPVFTTDHAFVPGTGNTWVSTGAAQGAAGASYSYDGGHTWQLFDGTGGVQYLAMDWISNYCGWAGAFSVSAFKEGFFKFVGSLPQDILTAPYNLTAALTGYDVHLTWEAPEGIISLVGYNVYRNNQLLTQVPVTDLSYDDPGLSNGQYEYCVTAVYSEGESTRICSSIGITFGIEEHSINKLDIFPNPVNCGMLNITCTSNFTSVCILNYCGQVIYENNHVCSNLQVITTSFKPGVYFVRVLMEDSLATVMIIIQ